MNQTNPISIERFRELVRASVMERLPEGLPVIVADDRSTYARGALTVFVGEMDGRVATTYDAKPSPSFGHSSSAAMPLPLTASSVDEIARTVADWLDDRFLHRS